jgi:uncharacterized protein (TIGR02246 family)
MNRRQALLTAMAGLSAAAATAPPAHAQASPGTNPELEQVRALLRAHDEAFTNQDLDGVMACLAEKAALMGTGPGEIWSGPEEIKVAYQHFFQGFDKGQQAFEYQFRIGDLATDMGWLMASGNVSGKKGGKDFAYPLNLSMTVAKKDGKWQIAAMHFSTLTGGDSGTQGEQ